MRRRSRSGPDRQGALEHRQRRFAAICGAVVLAIGAISFSNWMLHEPGAAPFPGTIAMKTNTAVALALLGSALLLVAAVPRARPARWIVRICCATVIALGVATLSQHVVGWDLGIDELLHREPFGEPATTQPNRMGPPATILLSLLGTALLLLASAHPRRRACAPYLALVAGAVVALPLLGYAYGVPELFGVATATGIAFSTAAAFALACVGVLFAGADTPLVRSLSASDPGGMLLRRLLPATLLLPVALGWLVVVGQSEQSFDPIFGTSILALSFLVLFSLILFRSAAVVTRVASEREKAERDGRELQDRLVHVLENMSQGFFEFGRRRRLNYVNREGERLLGAAPGSLADASLDQVFPSERFDELHRQVEAALASATTQHGELLVENPERWYAYDVVPSAEGVSIFAREVTERHHRESERRALLESERAARGEAERSNRTKDEFLATLSHELRTPLNAVLGWCHLLTQGRLSTPEVEQAARTIERNARIQSRLIDDLLEMSRIVSGKIRLDVQTLDFATIVDGALSAVSTAANAKQIDLRRLDPPEPATVRGDPARLQQIVWNLLSNAIKFTPRGGWVEIATRAGESQVEIVVRDSGSGISPDFLPYVFDRFRQADASMSRRHGGLGLGLSIVRQLAELHGGSVAAASDGPGCGSTFVVRLPVSPPRTPESDAREPGEEPAAAPESLVPGDRQVHGTRVLIVDDEDDARDVLRRILADAGAKVEVASSAAEALGKLGGRRFDVIVSDLGLPDQDGFEFIRHVRALPAESGGATPALAFTAFARREDRDRALVSGYQAHLAKPLQQSLLIAAVAKLASRERIGGETLLPRPLDPV